MRKTWICKNEMINLFFVFSCFTKLQILNPIPPVLTTFVALVLWGAVLPNRRHYKVNEWYVIYLWVFCDKLWKSFLCTFLFLSEESPIQGPALEQIYLFLERFATKMASRVRTSLKCSKIFLFLYSRNNYISTRHASFVANQISFVK